MGTLHGPHLLLLVLLLLLPLPHHAHLPCLLPLDHPHYLYHLPPLPLPGGRFWCKKKFIMRKPPPYTVKRKRAKYGKKWGKKRAKYRMGMGIGMGMGEEEEEEEEEDHDTASRCRPSRHPTMPARAPYAPVAPRSGATHTTTLPIDARAPARLTRTIHATTCGKNTTTRFATSCYNAVITPSHLPTRKELAMPSPAIRGQG